MKILVCGGYGFIGSAFIRNSLQNDSIDHLINIDSLTIGSNKKNLEKIENHKNYTFIHDDIQNNSKIDELVHNVDAVINFAAETHVDRSISNPQPFIQTNILGTYNILEAIRKYDKFFIHVSTDEVYGDANETLSHNEHSEIKPSNPYSATKAAADHLVHSYHRTYGIQCVTTRCSNNFGPYQFPEKLIPKTIIRSIKNLKIPLYGDGNQIRSWIYVDDHVSALNLLLNKGISGEVYNITSYHEISNKTIVKKILSLLDKSEDQIEFVNDRPGHDKRYSINSSKIENNLGWKPANNFDIVLEKTINWYLSNKSWWEPLVDEKVLHPQPWTLSWK